MAKIYKSYDDLLTFLHKDKNLTINDYGMAKNILMKTGYFSLISGYKDIFKNPTTRKFYDELKRCIKKYNPTEQVMTSMEFPADWMKIIRLKL